MKEAIIRSIETRIRAEFERAVAMTLDQNVLGTTAGALEHEAAHIFVLVDKEEATVSPSRNISQTFASIVVGYNV